MLTRFDPVEFRSYLARTFPGANLDSHPIDFGPVYLRFELGAPHPNGSDERIAQATERATVIFSELFTPDEQLTLIIKNWAWAGHQELFPSTSGHLASLIGRPLTDGVAQIITERQWDGAESSYEQILLPASVRDLDYRSIFRGIAHLEQGRDPRIGESIYFVSVGRAVVFYMYDDRGCLVFADRPEKLRPLYLNRRGWLVEPDSLAWSGMFDSHKGSQG
jgi:hypothetical protein